MNTIKLSKESLFMDTGKFLEGLEQFIKEAQLGPEAAYAVRYCLPMVDLEDAYNYAVKEAGNPLSGIFGSFREGLGEADALAHEAAGVVPIAKGGIGSMAKPQGGLGAAFKGGLKNTSAVASDDSRFVAARDAANKALPEVKPLSHDSMSAIKKPYSSGFDKATKATAVASVPAGIIAQGAIGEATKPTQATPTPTPAPAPKIEPGGLDTATAGKFQGHVTANDLAQMLYKHRWQAAAVLGLPLGALGLNAMLNKDDSDEA